MVRCMIVVLVAASSVLERIVMVLIFGRLYFFIIVCEFRFTLLERILC